MAAYGALVCLFNTMEQVKEHLIHGRLPLFVDRENIETLTERVHFLIDFLEHYHHSNTQVLKDLENWIRITAYAATDTIESNMGMQLLFKPTSHHKVEEAIVAIKKIATKIGGVRIKKLFTRLADGSQTKPKSKKRKSIQFDEAIRKIIGEMDSFKVKVMEVKDEGWFTSPSKLEPFQAPNESSKSPTTTNESCIGFDEYSVQIMEWLMEEKSKLEVVPIVGMGGIGKTTLARNVYANASIVERFYLRAWVTISQEYSLKHVLTTIRYSVWKQESAGGSLEAFIDRVNRKSEDQLGEELYKCLCGMRYLIIMDDVWSIETWENFKVYLPDNGNGSRIVLTTRLSDVASYFNANYRLEMRFLDKDTSWRLVQEKVFGQGGHCPLELVQIGKRISQSCGGLPLSLVVISGLLAKSERTPEYWEYIAANIKELVDSEDDGHCLKILSLSYDYLPIHLKPCFLHLSVFPEDRDIRVSKLVKLWVGEGFLKPSGTKSLEEIGEDCVKELIDRNLLLVHKRGSSGQNYKTCRIHGLMMKLCLQKASEEKFHCVNLDPISQPNVMWNGLAYAMSDLEILNAVVDGRDPYIRHLNSEGHFLKLVNARYRDLTRSNNLIRFPSSASVLWNLQTLVVRNKVFSSIHVDIAPSEIWEMPQLRHIVFDRVSLLNPPSHGPASHRRDVSYCILKNLQTLSKIVDFKCSEEVLKKIPNIKKLQIRYDNFSGKDPIGGKFYSLSNLKHLCKLESLSFYFHWLGRPKRNDLLKNLVFPFSVKKLTLCGSNLVWKDMSWIICSLPYLEVLKLQSGSFTGAEWNLIEDDGKSFNKLKYLLIEDCNDLMEWSADATHFPSLVSLVLIYMYLKEIPSGFGDVPTLRCIKVECCSDSAVISAKNIMEYQQGFGIEDLKVEVRLHHRSTLEISNAKNFLVLPYSSS